MTDKTSRELKQALIIHGKQSGYWSDDMDTVLVSTKNPPQILIDFIDRQVVEARIDELVHLKKIDAFNEAYSPDPRPSRLIDIRLAQLKDSHKAEPYGKGFLESKRHVQDKLNKLYMPTDDSHNKEGAE